MCEAAQCEPCGSELRAETCDATCPSACLGGSGKVRSSMCDASTCTSCSAELRSNCATEPEQPSEEAQTETEEEPSVDPLIAESVFDLWAQRDGGCPPYTAREKKTGLNFTAYTPRIIHPIADRAGVKYWDLTYNGLYPASWPPHEFIATNDEALICSC